MKEPHSSNVCAYGKYCVLGENIVCLGEILCA